MSSVRTSVLINCYNYEKYVADAIRSALEQTRAVDEIIVVDDGSKDGSLARITQAAAGARNVVVVTKANEGQLSAFNAGFENATGDILFFLDADDVYDAGHVERVCRVYEENPQVDQVWTGFRKTGAQDGEHHSCKRSVYFGSTVALACMSQKYIGGVTSTVSIRRGVAARVFPVGQEFYAAWRTRADDWLSHAMAVAGSRKYYLDAITVNYRIHDSNNYARKKQGAVEKHAYLKLRAAMYAHARAIAGVPEKVDALLLPEFRQHTRPSAVFLRLYMRTVWKHRGALTAGRMLSLWRGLAAHYLFPKSGGRAS